MWTVCVWTVDGEIDELGRDLALGRAGREAAQHLELALGEAGGQRRQRRRRARRRRRRRRGSRRARAAARRACAPPRPGRARRGAGAARRARAARRRRRAGRRRRRARPRACRPGSRSRRRARGGGSRAVRAARAPASGPGSARSDTGAGGPAPSSSGRSGPGRSQIPVGTATRPRSCSSPARCTSTASAAGMPLRGVAGQRRHAARVAVEPRGLEVRGVAERRERLVERGLVAERPPRPRLGLDDGRPEVVGVGEVQQLLRRVEVDRGDPRVQRAARPAPHHLGRRRAAADRVEHHGGVADGREARRLGDLLARAALGRALAVVALEAVEHRAARRPRAAAAGASRRRRPRSRPARPRRRTARRPTARLSIRSPPRPARNRSASTGRDGSIRSPRARTSTSSPPSRAAISCDVAAQPAKRSSAA